MFAYAKTKTQISFAVTAKLISAFVFATRIVQSLYYINPKFQASSHVLWLYSLVCVGPGRKPRRPVFSERGSFDRNLKDNFCQFSITYVFDAHQGNLNEHPQHGFLWSNRFITKLSPDSYMYIICSTVNFQTHYKTTPRFLTL